MRFQHLNCVIQLFLFFERLVQTSNRREEKNIFASDEVDMFVRFRVLSSMQQDGHIK